MKPVAKGKARAVVAGPEAASTKFIDKQCGGADGRGLFFGGWEAVTYGLDFYDVGTWVAQ